MVTDNYSRRAFLKTTLTGTGLVLGAPSLLRALTVGQKSHGGPAVERVALGRTGLKVSRLAQGTGYNGYRHSSAHTRMGFDKFETLVRYSLEQGINFLDMADLYGSHEFVRRCIRDVKRDELVMLSKIWPRKADWVTPSGGAKAEVDRFRKELGVDRLDVCLIHCATNDQWAEEYKRIRDELSELKARGVVRAVGVSCHDFGALKVASQHPWVDVIFARINHKGGKEYSMDGTAEEVSAVLKQARANGKAVVGMKIFGAGKLTKPDQKDTSLRYVLGNDLVDAMTIGMLNTEEVDDTITRLNKAYRAVKRRA